MRFIIRFLIGALLVLGLFYGVVIGSSEMAGEVITLRTFKPDGLGREVSLWIVQDHGQLYLRAGNPDADWLARIKENDSVEVVRGGVKTDYRAVIVTLPQVRQRVNQLMAEQYGWADRLISVMRDDSRTTPIRLERAGS